MSILKDYASYPWVRFFLNSSCNFFLFFIQLSHPWNRRWYKYELTNTQSRQSPPFLGQFWSKRKNQPTNIFCKTLWAVPLRWGWHQRFLLFAQTCMLGWSNPACLCHRHWADIFGLPIESYLCIHHTNHWQHANTEREWNKFRARNRWESQQ